MPISSLSIVTRRPPRIPCKITPASAIRPRLRTHRRLSPRQSQIARMIVRNPTAEAIRRWVCSNKIPPTHFEKGNRNMLYPNVVGQSGTARPTFLLVTIPPLQMSNSAATQMNHVKQFSHLVDFPTEEEYDEWDRWDKAERVRCWREKLTRQESGMRQVCFAAALRPATGKATRRLARCRPIRRVLSARLHNPAAYLLRASLSFRNDPDRIAGRKLLRPFRS